MDNNDKNNSFIGSLSEIKDESDETGKKYIKVSAKGSDIPYSYDGRYFGPVKTSNITGKLITFFWPLSRFGHTPS